MRAGEAVRQAEASGDPSMRRLDERHEHEQYFFTDDTVREICDMLEGFEHPCVLCAPMVGAELARRGRRVRVLDIDARFSSVTGFVHWDIYRPQFPEERYDVVFCDPPFFRVSLSQLFFAIRLLARHDSNVPIAVTHLSRRMHAVMGTFAPFNLVPTGYRPRYVTVENMDRNSIEVFANFDAPLWSPAAAALATQESEACT